jgi:hypothetical protein
MGKKQIRGNRAVFYHRDSQGRHDQAPRQYVAWAAAESERLGLEFDGSIETIVTMMANGQSVIGDIFLDYDVKGNQLERRGLTAFMRRIAEDTEVGHVFIAMPDRLARPNDPEDGMKLEKAIRRAGVTLHYLDRVLRPLAVGERAEISELLTGLIAYEQAGKFRRELAVMMINAQRSLGEQAFSTGGRPPFFLRRWLVDAAGNQIRELKDDSSGLLPENGESAP